MELSMSYDNASIIGANDDFICYLLVLRMSGVNMVIKSGENAVCSLCHKAFTEDGRIANHICPAIRTECDAKQASDKTTKKNAASV